MKTLNEYRDERVALLARAKSMVQLAQEEKREFTEEESTEYDAITAEETGKIAMVDKRIAQGERLEELDKQQALAKVKADREKEPGPPGTPKKIVVPPSAKARGSLRSYKREEDAYVAGQFLLAHIFNNEPAKKWCKEHGVIKGALSGNTGANVLVPDQMESALIDLREQYGVARQLCDIFPMSTDNATVPRRAGGVTVYAVADNATITASDPSWDAVTLAAKKWAALTKYSSEIAEDAVVSIADRITDEMAYALAVKEDACLIDGDGTSTYSGIVGMKTALAAGSEVTAPSADIAFSDLILDTFESMVGALPLYPGIQPRWIISQAAWAASMLRLAQAAGGNTTSNIEGGTGKSFLGYPVTICQSCNSTLTDQASTEGLVFFGDLRMGVLFGDRRGITVSATSDRYFELDQLAIKVTTRFDMNVHGAGTASAAGPIIQLLTPSA